MLAVSGCEEGQSIASASSNGSLHVWRVEYSTRGGAPGESCCTRSLHLRIPYCLLCSSRQGAQIRHPGSARNTILSLLVSIFICNPNLKFLFYFFVSKFSKFHRENSHCL